MLAHHLHMFVRKRMKKLLYIAILIFFLLWILINNWPQTFNIIFGSNDDIHFNLEKLKSFEFKRNNLKFNNVVQEKENVGEEEIENDKVIANQYLTNIQIGNDLNAAIEVHSNEQIVRLNKEDLIMKKGIKGIISENHANMFNVWNKNFLKANEAWNYRNFTNSEIMNLSILGRRLFLHEDIGHEINKTFLINIYKYGVILENRLIKHYSTKKYDPFEKCSVKNCRLSYKDEDFNKADAVLFHLHRMKESPSKIKRINYRQRWVWMSDESVFNTFVLAKDKILDHYDGVFNWSMTYRSTSDVPVPYGRTVPVFKKLEELDIFSQKNKTLAILGSNCGGKNNRWKYVKMLTEFIDVDTYGRCGLLKCPGHYNKDCNLLISYKFYLAFENSNCLQYITEKAWWNAFAKYSVPVVMGSSKHDYKSLFPPDSFIYVEDFASPKDLAEYIRFLASNKDAYNKYHAWRKNFAVLNEHGYFQTDVFHYCRLCEALNYNSLEPKTYTSMEAFWNVSRDCYPSTWNANFMKLKA